MSFLDIFNQLTAILYNELGVPIEDISLNARLREDLKIDGDDADELLCKINEQFGVDWHGFVFHRYFHEEPHLLSLFFECYYRLRYGTLKTITVSYIVLVIERGVWFS